MNPLLLIALMGGGRGGGSNNMLGLLMAPQMWMMAKLLNKSFGTRDILLSKMMPQIAMLSLITKPTIRRRRRYSRYRRSYNRYRRY